MKRLILVAIIFLSACSSSTPKIEDSNQSINEIRQQIKGLVGDFRSVSRNQREIVSGYFSERSDDTDFDPEKSKFRLWARFIILGDRRPYDIEIHVFKEQRIKGKYQLIGPEPKMGQKLVSELKEKLNQSLENRNIIDDFRVF